MNEILDRISRGEFRVGDHVMVNSGKIYTVTRVLDGDRAGLFEAVQIKDYYTPQARKYGPHRQFKASAFTLHKAVEHS